MATGISMVCTDDQVICCGCGTKTTFVIRCETVSTDVGLCICVSCWLCLVDEMERLIRLFEEEELDNP